MKFRWLLVIPFVAVAICCSLTPSVVGKWKVSPDFVSNPPKGLDTVFMTTFARTFKYEFKASHTFKSTMTWGTYTMRGKTILINTLSADGRPVAAKDQPMMSGDLSADGKTLILHIPDLSKVPALAALKDIKMVRDDGSN